MCFSKKETAPLQEKWRGKVRQVAFQNTQYILQQGFPFGRNGKNRRDLLVLFHLATQMCQLSEFFKMTLDKSLNSIKKLIT
jgi:hypothetical protein